MDSFLSAVRECLGDYSLFVAILLAYSLRAFDVTMRFVILVRLFQQAPIPAQHDCNKHARPGHQFSGTAASHVLDNALGSAQDNPPKPLAPSQTTFVQIQ